MCIQNPDCVDRRMSDSGSTCMKKEGIMMDQKRIREYMEAHRQEMIDDICALVRIDSERTEAKKESHLETVRQRRLQRAAGFWKSMDLRQITARTMQLTPD